MKDHSSLLVEIPLETNPHTCNTSTTTSEVPEEKQTTTVGSTPRKSLEIPRLFEEARQSIDIVQEAAKNETNRGAVTNGQESNPKKANKFLQKAKSKAIDISEHEMSVEKVCQSYGSHFNVEHPDKSLGLTSEVAEERLRMNGPNALSPPKKRPFIFKVIEQLTSLFSLLLIVAGLLGFIDVAIERTTDSLPNLFLGAILWLVVIFNATVTLWQERSSEKILESFMQMQSESSWVLRDGITLKLPCEQLVLGDIVKIEAGDKIPADMRVLQCSALKLDNSSLTGEAEPQLRSVEMSSKNPLETSNLVFYGTLVIEGSGYGIVIRCGNQSVIGQIALLAGSTITLKTPLRREIDSFVRKIGILAFGMALMFFVLGFIIGNSWFQNFIFAIGIITANIPQGLIATVTACLTVSASRLKAVNVLVKKLEHVETLGSTSVICSDKTGTITQNRMTLVEMWYDNIMQNIQYPNRLMMNKLTDTPLKTFSKESEEQLSTYEKLTRCAALCSTAYLLNDDTNMRKPILDRECKGDASEAALVKFVETRNDCATLKEIRQEFTEIFALPFNSKNKYMISVVKNNQQQSNDGKVTLLMKGAPERVFQRCSYIQVNGKTLPMDDTWKDAFQDAYNFMASKGERVLGFAQALVDEHVVQQGKEQQENDNPFALQLEGLVFLGICGLSDPPKVGVTEAIHKCKTAGIQVVMVTGDHPATAKAIAKQVGIIENNAKTIEDIAEEEGLDLKNIKEIPYSRTDAVVLHGEEIDKLSDKDWSQILKKKQIVFSRTSPQQKLLIVSKFQELGHCVAVTGDGTNDSPALKKADIGVAMNISGSAVSKEAAALILLDDNFASIVNGVQEGRLIFDNLKKSIAYTLTHLFPEIGPFLAYVVFGLPLPLTGLLVLCIDLGTELVAAVSLAFENAESDIMHVPPRSRHDSLVGAPVLSYSYLQMGMIETMACFMNYFFVFAHYGIPPKYLWWAAKNGYFSSDTKTDLFITETGLYISPSLQLNILNTAQTAYFLGVVVCQWITLFCTKTRRVSIFTHGIFGNLVVYLGIIFAVCLLCIFVYCPFIGDFIFQSRYLVIDFWLYPLPWMAFMFFYDELRKLCIRKLNLSFLFW